MDFRLLDVNSNVTMDLKLWRGGCNMIMYLLRPSYALEPSIYHNTQPIAKSFSFFHGMGCRHAKENQCSNATMEDETMGKHK
jgi:hypothetical protein